jgi:hypothetical protein
LAFKDRFPTEIEFDIDRDGYLRYLKAQAWLGCFGISSPFMLLLTGGLFQEKMAPFRDAGFGYQFGWLVLCSIAGLGAGGIFSSILYFGYFGPSARRKAKNLRLLVDGPYLRMVTGGFIVVDQRFHFRDVSCYTTVQGPLLRYLGLKSLRFRVQERSAAPPLAVHGLVDPDGARDDLCEIDASRELVHDISAPRDNHSQA